MTVLTPPRRLWLHRNWNAAIMLPYITLVAVLFILAIVVFDAFGH